MSSFYFSKIPNTMYEFNSTSFLVKDITNRSKFVTELWPYTSIYTVHEIVDGETAQSLAIEYYKSVAYYWVILLFNEIHNLYFEWPMDPILLDAYLNSKYNKNDIYKTKHWEIDGVVVGTVAEYDKTVDWVVPENPEPNNIFCERITFYEYENRLNDSRRLIKILTPDLLSDFVLQFENSFKT